MPDFANTSMVRQTDHNQDQHCSFLHLPAELRLNIYNRLYTDLTCGVYYNDTHFAFADNRPNNTHLPASLLSTCRQIWSEARPILFANTESTFDFVQDLSEKPVIVLYKDQQHSVADLPAIDLMHNVEIAIALPASEDEPDLQYALSTLLTRLNHCKHIKQLRLCVTIDLQASESMPHHKVVLESLCEVVQTPKQIKCDGDVELSVKAAKYSNEVYGGASGMVREQESQAAGKA